MSVIVLIIVALVGVALVIVALVGVALIAPEIIIPSLNGLSIERPIWVIVLNGDVACITILGKITLLRNQIGCILVTAVFSKKAGTRTDQAHAPP